MSELSDLSNPNATTENQQPVVPEQPVVTQPAVDVGLSGVSAQGEVGSVAAAPTPAAAPVEPAADITTQGLAVPQPAVSQAPDGMLVEGVGLITSHFAVPADKFQDVLAKLNKLEREALFWGGDVGVVMRNLVCEVRLHLTGRSHSDTPEGN